MSLHMALRQEETRLRALVDSEHPDDAQVLAQIDRVAGARAELEKANGRMLFGIRRTLTAEQWRKLQELGYGQTMRMGMGQGMGMGGGPRRGPPN